MIQRNKCRMCSKKNLKEVLNLGNHSLVNSYLKRISIKRIIITFKIHQCIRCGLIQMLKTVDPKKFTVVVNIFTFQEMYLV